VETGRLLRALPADHAPVWAPDGRWLATRAPGGISREGAFITLNNAENGHLHLWEVSRPVAVTVLPAAIECLSFNPDGSRLAANDVLLDVGEVRGALRLRRSGRPLPGSRALFLPDGQLWSVEFQSPDGSAQMWQHGPQERPLRIPRPVAVEHPCLALVPDGSAVFLSQRAPKKPDLFNRDCVQRCELSGDQQRTSWEPTRNEFHYQVLCVRPDGRAIALVGPNECVLRDVATGKPLPPLSFMLSVPGGSKGYAGGWGSCAAFSLDGQRLFVVQTGRTSSSLTSFRARLPASAGICAAS
jgi:hypothetical protein